MRNPVSTPSARAPLAGGGAGPDSSGPYSATVAVTVNGIPHEREVEARRLLVHFLRDDLGLTGTHVGCDTGNCGACTVILDGLAVKSCTLLAAQASGGALETVEGLADGDGGLHPLQEAFSRHHGLQCGYCTPGMLMSAKHLLDHNPEPTETEIRKAIQGNICRCTGYWNIVESIAARGEGGGGVVSATTTTAPERESAATRLAGQSIPRKEDGRLVQGQGVFVDDVRRHGTGYVHFVRSPYAHARILSVDVSRALELPGVYGTLTGDEVTTLTEPFFEMMTPPADAMRDYALAVGRVRHMGEPVAAVVADTRERARDAADLVEVEYEPLPVLVDAERALAPDAPILHDEIGSNVVWSGCFDWGDWDAARAEADHVFTIDRLHFDRFASTPLETSGCLVEFERGSGQWTIHCNHQMPGVAAIWMAPALRVGTDKLRFVTQDIGGGFGNKICLHPQYVACCLLTRKLGRPVQWTEWRTDQHVANSHGNERVFRDVEVAVMTDGTILGFSARAIDDCGAFARYEPLGCIIWSHVPTGCYRWRNVRVDFTQVVTNKSPAGPNRGYSRMQHIWLCERIVDIVAHELDLDPVETRKRNYIAADEMPWQAPNGCVYDSGDYARCLDLALELVGYERLEERRADAEARGKLLGLGIGSTLDSGTNNFGQSQILNPALQFSGNNEAATIKLDIFGEIVLTLGTVPQGQSHETVAAQVAAGILGCRPEDVNVRPGHDTWWNSHAGFSGTYASQFAVTGLSAVKNASEKLRGEIQRLAAAVLGASPDEIVLEDGAAHVAGDPERSLPFMACGAIVNANNAGLPAELDDVTLNCRAVYRPPFEVPDLERKYGNLSLTWATQIHACVIEVDRETGVVDIVDYAAVDDCGVRIHPQIVEGQVHGATAHAIGAALFESFAYDENGNLLTPNFYDYHVPHALDMPPLETGWIESPSPFSPLGTKGMGEGGGGAIHAVCAALQDALRPVGRPIVHDSFNPYHRVWEMMRDPGSTRTLLRVTSR